MKREDKMRRQSEQAKNQPCEPVGGASKERVRCVDAWKRNKTIQLLDFSTFQLNHSVVKPFSHSARNGFTIIEVVVVFLLILGVTFLVFPKSLDNTRQAKLVSKWAQKYSQLKYMFSVVKAQQDSELKERFKEAQNNNTRSDILLETIKPYLRITSEVKSGYKQYYMNKESVPANAKYYFDKLYFTSSDEILGLKWVNEKCKANDPCAMLVFDVNGSLPPNTWGYDVFGINVFKEKIEPLGKEAFPGYLKFDCSNKGLGVYCSYYYLIGGKFD